VNSGPMSESVSKIRSAREAVAVAACVCVGFLDAKDTKALDSLVRSLRLAQEHLTNAEVQATKLSKEEKP